MQLVINNAPLLVRYARYFCQHPYNAVGTNHDELVTKALHLAFPEQMMFLAGSAIVDNKLHHFALRHNEQYLWSWSYCPYCDNVYGTEAYFKDWLLAQGCRACRYGVAVVPTYTEQAGRIVQHVNLMSATYLLLDEPSCELLENYLFKKYLTQGRTLDKLLPLDKE